MLVSSVHIGATGKELFHPIGVARTDRLDEIRLYGRPVERCMHESEDRQLRSHADHLGSGPGVRGWLGLWLQRTAHFVEARSVHLLGER